MTAAVDLCSSYDSVSTTDLSVGTTTNTDTNCDTSSCDPDIALQQVLLLILLLIPHVPYNDSNIKSTGQLIIIDDSCLNNDSVSASDLNVDSTNNDAAIHTSLSVASVSFDKMI